METKNIEQRVDELEKQVNEVSKDVRHLMIIAKVNSVFMTLITVGQIVLIVKAH